MLVSGKDVLLVKNAVALTPRRSVPEQLEEEEWGDQWTQVHV